MGEKLGEAEILYLPSMVLGELCYGAHRSRSPDKALAQVLAFLRLCMTVAPDETTAQYYGRIKAELAAAGTPIPDNDIWLAALALVEYRVPLATRDGHFAAVAELTVVAW